MLKLYNESFFDDYQDYRGHRYFEAFWELIQQHVPEPRVAAEIGSARGRWAKDFLSRFPSVEYLFCVDIWERARTLTPNRAMKLWENNIKADLFKRVFPLNGTSAFWSAAFPFELDFLYLDADKRPGARLISMEEWVPKVRSGGLIVGHDYSAKFGKMECDEFWGPGNYNLIEIGPQGVVSWWALKE